jgi:hypothetical protein
MRRFTTLILGALIGGSTVYAAFQYHLIHADQGHIVVPKTRATLADSYVDVRDWRAADWVAHNILKEAVVAAGYRDLVVQPAKDELLRRFFGGFGGARGHLHRGQP